MKLFAIFAAVLVIAVSVQGAAPRPDDEHKDALPEQQEESVVPRKFLTKLVKLGALSKLKGDGHDNNGKDVVVVYVKDDKRRKNHYHGGSRWESSEEYVYKKPVRKVRPVKWESYEDDSIEYVRPHRRPTTVKRVVKPVYVSHYDSDESKETWGNWGNWGNWFNKGKGGNKWGHDDDSRETIVIKGGHRGGHRGGDRWGDRWGDDSDSYEHGSHGGNKWNKWSKWD